MCYKLFYNVQTQHKWFSRFHYIICLQAWHSGLLCEVNNKRTIEIKNNNNNRVLNLSRNFRSFLERQMVAVRDWVTWLKAQTQSVVAKPIFGPTFVHYQLLGPTTQQVLNIYYFILNLYNKSLWKMLSLLQKGGNRGI